MSNSSIKSFVRLPEEKWRDTFEGWQIVDIALVAADRMCLVTRKLVDPEVASRAWDSDIPTRLSYLFTDGDRGGLEFTGYAFPKAGSCQHPLRQALISNKNSVGQVYAAGSGQMGSEQVHYPTENGDIVSIRRIKRIQGWAYAVSRFRRIFKRVEVGRWEELRGGLENLPPETDWSSIGFNDIDGLAENNLYAVGGRGEVFHFDGTRWTRCDFPTNQQLYTVTVAPDGTAYITSLDGSIWAGQHDNWKVVDKADHGIEYNDSVWFNDQLWLCSDYHLHIWDGEQRRRPEYNDQQILHAGHMDALDGVLVVAGPGTVHAFDGADWHQLVWPYPSND